MSAVGAAALYRFCWLRNLLPLVAALGLASAAAAQTPCPVAPDPTALPDAAALRKMNAFVAKLGARPTGSRAHARYVDWIRRQLTRIPGVTVNEIEYPIQRWTEKRVKLVLEVDGKRTRVPVAGPIPYAAPTDSRGVSAPLVVVPAGQTIGAANAAGRIVVRPAPAGALPYGVLLIPLISWGHYDPESTIDPTKTFHGDFLAYNSRVADLRDAAAAGAAGLLFVKELPRRQLLGHYEPYEGTQWSVAGAFLGAEEGQLLMDAIEGGTQPSARLIVRAHVDPVVTPTILATIPGQSPERIVIDSHTDGTNAVEDNGPVAMVAMARYFAALPAACRPRTIQLAFTTAHFYQRVVDPAVRDGGAEQLARQLDLDYDQGTVSVVLVLEHLGALDYEQVPSPDGIGSRLEKNGLRSVQFIAITPSPALIANVEAVVQAYDMQRTILLRGADVPGETVPEHCSFGGQGTPYNRHLLPTVGVIAAPQSLYNPVFGLDGIDFDVMHDELLGFTELVNRLGTMEQSAIAGDVPAERALRAGGAPGCPEAN